MSCIKFHDVIAPYVDDYTSTYVGVMMMKEQCIPFGVGLKSAKSIYIAGEETLRKDGEEKEIMEKRILPSLGKVSNIEIQRAVLDASYVEKVGMLESNKVVLSRKVSSLWVLHKGLVRVVSQVAGSSHG
ncbi:hypothetical protein L2E82_15186 [Cichorium intybus]|uniref:Uncharacterized protein n=1 Tax=Cichorium intybus TaxID=13427 RepID=A0ACB9F1J5_CICIN|nr:hypothetical protein L2E82_15186 [Cichorium intybus]